MYQQRVKHFTVNEDKRDKYNNKWLRNLKINMQNANEYRAHKSSNFFLKKTIFNKINLTLLVINLSQDYVVGKWWSEPNARVEADNGGTVKRRSTISHIWCRPKPTNKSQLQHMQSEFTLRHLDFHITEQVYDKQRKEIS